jgi:two-component system, chemotaxis family, chemotaxis protein CheY
MHLKGNTLMTSVLLIDEDGAELQRLGAMLGGLGLDLIKTGQGDEALKVCNDNSPDLVMLAASSSRTRSKDFVKRLRRPSHGKSPIVILYADKPDMELIGQSILQGAADFIMKPFDRDLLQFKLKQAGVLA